ncbi:MAG: histidine triad nucleotide-binding protein [Candidatus Wildermuthbacteria bacterium RIFCSPHIGHO2_02_FULL_49_9]|uniref:Histidine triad nucleotide-binding protein n=1 Tax=Candidatus Wildermuthbacteria bacterium RIFCSPHIGHO2_02_FULL_49_9 TaxID=1802456 RepID=A0A1G2RGM5_9BACT|nr:MAG: histidine triad nucleotide-binding protein [Candidatus Wildermuthbacteria bacterium RIFCSPHIGHO2_02_FULL_49_9]
MENCLFCKIARKEMPANIVFEDSQFVAFRDIKPKAPFHLLIVPKKHIHSVDHVKEQDRELMGDLILTARKVARQHELAGYQLHFNVGREGGQIIDHIHLHLLADPVRNLQKDNKRSASGK